MINVLRLIIVAFILMIIKLVAELLDDDDDEVDTPYEQRYKVYMNVRSDRI